MINIPFAFMAGQAAAPPGYLLDTYTGAAMAYSTRQLSSTATNCLQAINSGGTTQDIGFSGGFLDTASLLSFAAGGDLRVKIWYDQSGNSRDLTNSTYANCPTIVLSGVVQTVNGLASVLMSDGASTGKTLSTVSTVPSTNDLSVYFVGTKSPSFNTYVFGGTSGGSIPAYLSEYGGTDFEWYCGSTERYTFSASGGSTVNLSSVAATRSFGTNGLKGYFNGSNVFTQTTTLNLNGDFQSLGGSSPTQDLFRGNVTEWLVWAGTNNDASASGIISDQIAYFSI